MEGWHESPLGRMYYPTYIVGGVAIHGSSYVAEYPRTHGCIAVPIFAAVRLSELMPLGTLVIVRS
jgi:lipoprotein-anchoring transpeptidase ErfK/SrfK